MDCDAKVDPTVNEGRLCIEYLTSPTEYHGEDVIMGLSASQKKIPSRYLYDNNGSQLFEEICQLPEYYPTRTESQILEENASRIAAITGACELVEFGSGSSIKTRLLLDAYQKLNLPLHYCPIDVSAAALATSASDLLSRYGTLKFHGFVGTYEQALLQLKQPVLPHRMIVFIGSSIGNFTTDECDHFLQHVVDVVQPGDYFLLGVDLDKNKEQLEAAYNDAQGVTEMFTKNVLNHLNSRFGGNFSVSRFQQLSFYNQQDRRIEIYLKSLSFQRVELIQLGLTVEINEGETIMTEISRKFELQQLKAELEAKRLICMEIWTDPNTWCAVILCRLMKN